MKMQKLPRQIQTSLVKRGPEQTLWNDFQVFCILQPIKCANAKKTEMQLFVLFIGLKADKRAPWQVQ